MAQIFSSISLETKGKNTWSNDDIKARNSGKGAKPLENGDIMQSIILKPCEDPAVLAGNRVDSAGSCREEDGSPWQMKSVTLIFKLNLLGYRINSSWMKRVAFKKPFNGQNAPF
jgi:hypothetical protein